MQARFAAESLFRQNFKAFEPLLLLLPAFVFFVGRSDRRNRSKVETDWFFLVGAQGLHE